MTHQERESWRLYHHLGKERREIWSELPLWLETMRPELKIELTMKPRSKDDVESRHELAFVKRQTNRIYGEFSRRLHGKRWRSRRKGLYGIHAYELSKRREWHVHSLVWGAAGRPKFFSRFHEYCKGDKVLGYAWIEYVTDGGVRYATKYATKDGRWEPFGEPPADLVTQLAKECGRHACSSSTER